MRWCDDIRRVSEADFSGLIDPALGPSNGLGLCLIAPRQGVAAREFAADAMSLGARLSRRNPCLRAWPSGALLVMSFRKDSEHSGGDPGCHDWRPSLELALSGLDSLRVGVLEAGLSPNATGRYMLERVLEAVTIYLERHSDRAIVALDPSLMSPRDFRTLAPLGKGGIAARTHWDVGEDAAAGYEMFESLAGSRERLAWLARVLAACTRLVPGVPAPARAALALAERGSDLGEAKRIFHELRSLLLADDRRRGSRTPGPEAVVLGIAELVCKSIHNESGACPHFDRDSAWHIPEVSRWLLARTATDAHSSVIDALFGRNCV